MQLTVVFFVVGVISLLFSLCHLLGFSVALYFHDGDAIAFFNSFIISFFLGLTLFLTCRKETFQVGHREGFLIVAMSWISAAFLSSLPFLLSKSFDTPLNAVFEAVSGITTTGASILTDIENMPHGILFWRNLIHWIGGMGIIIISLTILPVLGIGGMQLYKAEASVVSGDKFAPRIKEMARILLYIYLSFSLVLYVLLLMSGMNAYDAFIHMTGSVGTAGFSNKNASVGAFESLHIEAIIIVFMVLGATSFSIHYRFLSKGFKAYSESEEFKFFASIMILAIAIITINLYGNTYDSLTSAFRYASFQVVSIATTTGFSTADFSLWPPLSQSVLLMLMFVGGNAGSTTGAIKCIRLLLLLKIGYKEMYTLIHPHAVKPVKLGGRTVPAEVLNGVMGFTFLFIALFSISTVIFSGLGYDFLSAMSTSVASLGNIGPALGIHGPMTGYSEMPVIGKIIFIFNMLLGRIEIYALFILLLPAFWRD